MNSSIVGQFRPSIFDLHQPSTNNSISANNSIFSMASNSISSIASTSSFMRPSTSSISNNLSSVITINENENENENDVNGNGNGRLPSIATIPGISSIPLNIPLSSSLKTAVSEEKELIKMNKTEDGKENEKFESKEEYKLSEESNGKNSTKSSTSSAVTFTEINSPKTKRCSKGDILEDNVNKPEKSIKISSLLT